MRYTMTAFFGRTSFKALASMAGVMTVLSLLLSLAACSGSDDDTDEKDNEHYILFGSSSKGGDIEWANGRIGSRTDEKLVESEIPENLGVFAFGDGSNVVYVFKDRRVYYKDAASFAFTSGSPTTNNRTKFGWQHYDLSDWPYTEDETEVASVQRKWEKMRYRFFAYSPWTSAEDVSVESENYAGFNTFTWDKIPGFTKFDYVVSNKIVDVDNRMSKMKTDSLVKFEMRHILSRIRFFFKMSPEYRKIRKIELNSLTILAAGKVKTATFNFVNGSWDETVHWSNEELGDPEPVVLTNATTLEYILPTTYPTDPFTSVYVYPQENFKEIKMQLAYTVYDSKGVATRRANVTNTVTIAGSGWNLESGYYYDIYINVLPDYLYVLSDNDQDFDGFVIIKE